VDGVRQRLPHRAGGGVARGGVQQTLVASRQHLPQPGAASDNRPPVHFDQTMRRYRVHEVFDGIQRIGGHGVNSP
jgi:hypothetical protein